MTDESPNMKKPTNDELLSAYVDGELTDEERAQVEECLRTDPEARQMVAELQELSATLRALPRETVGKDLRATVLQQGEKSLPLETSVSRRWAWAVMAVAATLVLAVYLPESQQRDERQLAAQDKSSELDQLQSLKSSAEAAKAPQAMVQPGEGAFATAEAAVAGEEVAPQLGARSKEYYAQAKGLAPTYQVHVTFTESKKFTELLTKQGLAYQKVSQLNDETETREPVVNEQLLVEAPANQIEQLLAACHADVQACQSLRITPTQEKHYSWSHWERDGNAVASGKLALDSAKEQEVLEDASSAEQSTQRKKMENQNEQVAELPQRRQAEVSAATRSKTAQGLSKTSKDLKPVRVLFILREWSSPASSLE